MAAVPAGALAALALLPSIASAEPCAGGLAGGAKSGWGIDAAEGTFDDAALPDPSEPFDGLRIDAFDDYARATVDGTGYVTPDGNACKRSLGGQQITFPSSDIGDIRVTPSLYVDRRKAFGREVVTLGNTSTSAATVDFVFDGELGSDADTKIFRTSSGDKVVSGADAWSVSCEDGADDGCAKSDREDPELANNWERRGSKGESADAVVLDDTDVFDVRFNNVKIPAGKRISFMIVATLARNAKAALDAAKRVNGDPRGYGLFRGMSRGEQRRVVNW
jgi:hypothetical protein